MFFDKSSLTLHIKTQLYPCEHCDRKFQNKAGLGDHKLIHGKKTEENNGEGQNSLTIKKKAIILDVHKHIESLMLTLRFYISEKSCRKNCALSQWGQH